MSNVSGSIAVNVEFRDATSVANVQSLKTISLRDTKDYATGKIAIVSGTVGTTEVMLWNPNEGGIAFGGYKDSSGNAVTFVNVTRIAVRGSGNGVEVRDADLGTVELVSVNGDVSVGNNLGLNLSVMSLGGTVSFTAILYGT